MRWSTIATDYDGTIASDGKVDANTIDALRRARAAGVRLLLVTGRELADLFNTFAGTDVFDLVVAENGAVILDPATGQVRVLADPPPQTLVEALTTDNVPFSVGHSIVATVEPYDQQLVSAIAALHLPWRVIPNKGSIMALPHGVSKASGLLAAFTTLGLEPGQTIAIGDAENDVEMLRLCGLGVAVNNALPMVKAIARITTAHDRGEGVVELVDRVLAGEFDSDPIV